MANNTTKLYFQTVPNPLKEQGTAYYDYIGQFLSNGTMTLDVLCEQIAKGRANLDAPTVKLVVKTLFAVIAEGIAENNVRYNLDGISFETAITGSVPSMDSPLTDENELYVLVSVGDPIRSAMSKLTASNVNATGSSVRIDAVEDAATCDKGVIHGKDRAIVTGRNISASRAGESIYLADVDTMVVKSTGTVVAEDGVGQRIEVNFAAPFEAGTYWLTLATRGYATPDADVATYRKKVTATEAVLVPALTKIQQGNKAAGVAGFGQGEAAVITLTGVIPDGKQAGDKLMLYLLDTDGSTVLAQMDATSYITASTETTLTLGNGLDNDSAKPDGDWQNHQAKFEFQRGGANYPLTFTFLNA